MVRWLAFGVALWLCAGRVAAQADAAVESPRVRALLLSGALHLDFEDLPGAEAAYVEAHRLEPSVETALGLARVACERANFGDCAAWVRKALSTSERRLSPAQVEQARWLLRRAEAPAWTRAESTSIALAVAMEPLREITPAGRARGGLVTVLSLVVTAALAGTLVALASP